MAKKNGDKVDQWIRQGVERDTPIGAYLQETYWSIVKEMRLSSNDWKDMAKAFANDERYRGRSTAEPNERHSRLATALTSGNMPGVGVDLTWKRFIEGLVLLGIDTLTITMKGKRGKFGSSAIVSASCHPHLDLLKTLNREDEETVTRSASNALNHYFENPRNTATKVMEHILLKLLWGFFAEYDIRADMWRRLAAAYVNNPKNCPALSNRRSDMRHNLESAIRYTKKLTWKRFLQALKAMDLRDVSCTFKVRDSRGWEHEVGLTIDLTKLVLRSNSDGTE
ncbi:hypothetical protein pEaSNUABM8_00253 [Erwinia phage pEa_SNUABM_8]|nr:hypothetical protein pEaSNUABM8_00253 [Erwinia phage pEa_SNUABM_8]QVW55005.1 hypothetical protein pEaSNUABM4_00252 [Erwinia phage pEa_SNUABM_4]